MPCIWVKKYVSSDKKLVRWFFIRDHIDPGILGIVTAVVEIAGLFWWLGKWSNLTTVIFFPMGWCNHQPGSYIYCIGNLGHDRLFLSGWGSLSFRRLITDDGNPPQKNRALWTLEMHQKNVKEGCWNITPWKFYGWNPKMEGVEADFPFSNRWFCRFHANSPGCIILMIQQFTQM